MALTIEDPVTEKVVRELAEATGETIETAIGRAVAQRLHRVQSLRARRLADEIMEIGRRCAALPDFDTRSAEEILGYDEFGLPT
jgi:antitoxin VapB